MRPRLTKKLNHGLENTLILVCVGADFGKSDLSWVYQAQLNKNSKFFVCSDCWIQYNYVFQGLSCPVVSFRFG